ncbi:unnamed protein product [Bemisia tabaci]|uniref:Innexin n=1 Tax=Bemisia tabaci TaxID=7038 RepID=A0A9P0A4V8_BEMTA|nr:unnamed protein product [Bemisia tabaci]
MISFVKDIDHFKFIWSHGDVKIDTWVSSLHYRLTVALLLVLFGIACNQQYFGEPIQCVNDKNSNLPVKVMNNYCFVTSTYTIIKSTESSHQSSNLPPHSEIPDKSETRLHFYYQWVPLMLLLQAVLFRLPYIGWETWEGGLLRGLTTNINDQQKLRILAKYIVQRINTHQVWLSGFILCEMFTFLNLVGVIMMTHYLLGGYFLAYGVELLRFSLGPHFESIGLNSLLSNGKNPAETLFPKLTKCTLQRYGPSGGIQNHDFLCVMTLNVVNEKIFAVLWFWYLLLLIVNGFNLAWRFVSYLTVVSCAGSASNAKNRIMLFASCLPSIKDPNFYQFVSKKFFYSDWMVLSFLQQNLPTTLFLQLTREVTALCKK